MPTYAYRCSSCGHEFEAVQKMSDDPLTTCPECGAPIKRVIFPAGIVFKGSGWYITDSRKSDDGKAKAGNTSGTSAASSDKAEKTSSDTKDSTPAPAADAKPAKAATE
ncbi:MAG: zinc ribbon domain-containing protein [Thermomicrobiales bacterium]